ncbi:MAG: formylmethanofuran dehydrogenase subunit A [Methermicoccaceae archaeon]
MAGNIIIKGGHVFDPLNKVNGDVMDIFIKDGRVVDRLDEKDAKVIDATGKTVMPGGVDSHSHVGGAKVNAGRMMRPEDSYQWTRKKTANTYGGSGYTVPSVYLTGYEYATMGYTTVFEAAMPPLEARHTHEEMRATPILDMGAYLVFGNNWFVMRYLREGDIEKAAAYVAWMLKTHKGYGIKCVNPAGVENWGWAQNVSSLDEENIHFQVTPEEMIHGLAEVAEMLGLPIPLHLHANNLGHPGCWEITKESLDTPSDVKANMNITNAVESETVVDWKRHQSIYLAHAQFNSFAGTSWRDFESGAREIVDYVNSKDHVVIDNGAVPFGPATVMTGDGPAIHDLYTLVGGKWSNADIELECGAGVLTFNYLKKNAVHSVQWAMGLELILLMDDMYKCILTTDHPNGGPFTKYPLVISWLMSQKAREATMDTCHNWAVDKSELGGIDRELSLYDIAIITRANSARTVGIAHRKGHLGVGADGDVTIYDINPNDMNVDNYSELEEKFSRADYTIKDGEVVARDGEIVSTPQGRIFYTEAEASEDAERDVLRDVKEWFKYYTVGFANYPVDKRYLRNPTPISTSMYKVR